MPLPGYVITGRITRTAFGSTLLGSRAHVGRRESYVAPVVVTCDRTQWQLLGASLLFSAAVAVSTMIIGFGIATWLAGHKRLTWISHFLLPVLIVIPPYLYAIIWASPLNAVTIWFLDHWIIAPAIWGWLNAWWTEVMSYLPLAVGSAIVGFACVDPSLVAAGRVAQSEERVFWRILLPLALPSLYAGASIIFLFSLLEYGVPALFFVTVYAIETFAQFSLDGRPGPAVLTVLPLILLSAGILYGILGRVRQVASMRMHDDESLFLFRRHSFGWRLFHGVAITILAIQVLLPLEYLLRSVHSPLLFWQVATAASHEVATTIILALMVVLTGIPISMFLANCLAQPGRANSFWWIIVCLPLALPASLLGISMIALVRIPGLSSFPQAWMTVAGSLAHTLPLAALLGYVVLQRTNRQYFEAGSIFQRSSLLGFWRIWLPLSAMGFMSGGVLLVTRTFGELEATLLVVAPGSATLMMRLYNLLHYGASPEVSALTLLLMLLIGVASLLLLVGFILAKRMRMNGEQL